MNDFARNSDSSNLKTSLSDEPGQPLPNGVSTPTSHRRIPLLPERPHVHPISGHLSRSYSGGRQNFSRASQGNPLTFTITAEEPLPDGVQANLVTTLNAAKGNPAWSRIPFERSDTRTLKCCLTPQYPGLHSFRAEFSRDNGATWQRDIIPDAWILIDPPQVDGLRLYTLIPSVSGTIADWTADLQRIRDMGFNAVYLLPITARDSSKSPYSAHDLFTVDTGYLKEDSGQDGWAQLEAFVAEAKALGLRLCFDLVLNHIGVNSRMAQRAPDWIVPDDSQSDGFKRARYWSNEHWHVWEDLILIDYEHPSEAIRAEIWAYMIDYALFWAKYANDTGGFVRFDNLHSSNPNFLNALTRALQSEYPEVGCIAEYFTDENTLLRTGAAWGLNLNLATPWDYKFVPQLRDYLKYIHRISEHLRYFMPITSHDSGTPTEEFGNPDSTIPRYVSAALLGTGATGIPQGVEFGESHHIAFIGKYPKREFPKEAKFAGLIRRVNTILAENPVFRCGGNCHFVDGDHSAIIAAFRRDESDESFGFLVVCNFDTQNPQTISLDLSQFLGNEGPFSACDLFAGEARQFTDSRFDLQLPPCTAQVLGFPRNGKCREERQSA